MDNIDRELQKDDTLKMISAYAIGNIVGAAMLGLISVFAPTLPKWFTKKNDEIE